MDIKEALSIFKREVNKKVIGYEDRGDKFILITDAPDGPYDETYYEVDRSGVKVTNPIIAKVNYKKIVKI